MVPLQRHARDPLRPGAVWLPGRQLHRPNRHLHLHALQGTFASSPAAQGAPVAAQTIQTKAGPTRTGFPDVAAVQPAADGGPPAPLGSDGHFVSGVFDPQGRAKQVYTTNVLLPAGFHPIPVDVATTPHVVYIAFDAASLPSGAPRPAAAVSITAPHGAPTLFAVGPYGLLRFPYIVDGQYTLTLTDPATGETLLTTAFGTASAVVTDKASYIGGTGATVRFGFGSGTGNPTIVCVANSGTGAGAQFAANGSIAALNNGGAGVGTVTGLGVNATPYALTVYTVTFSDGPQFIQSVTGTGQNCGAGTGAGAMAGPQVTNGTGATATLTPVPGPSAMPTATFTINP